MRRGAPAADPAAPDAWDVRMRRAFPEDVEHVEVLPRDLIAHRLEADRLRRADADDPSAADPRWNDPDPNNLNERFASSVGKAKPDDAVGFAIGFAAAREERSRAGPGFALQ